MLQDTVLYIYIYIHIGSSHVSQLEATCDLHPPSTSANPRQVLQLSVGLRASAKSVAQVLKFRRCLEKCRPKL